MTASPSDDANPYGRASVWPQMPQAPFRVGGPMGAVVGRPAPAPPPERPERVIEALIEPPVALEAPPLEPHSFAIPPPPEPEPGPVLDTAPMVAPIGPRRGPAPPPGLRLTPLIAAAAVGAGGTLALVLLVGSGRPPPVVRPPVTLPTAAPSPLAVSGLVGETAGPAAAAASPAPAPRAEVPARAVANVAAPRLALSTRTPRPGAVAALTAAAPPLPASPEPARSLSTEIQLPAARPIASLAGPAEPPLSAPASAPAFTPKPAPDPNAPIPTHAPDAN